MIAKTIGGHSSLNAGDVISEQTEESEEDEKQVEEEKSMESDISVQSVDKKWGKVKHLSVEETIAKEEAIADTQNERLRKVYEKQRIIQSRQGLSNPENSKEI